MRRWVVRWAVGVALASAAGCVLSTSSESISKSVSSPITLASNLSNSSSSQGDETAYRHDVAEYTDAYVRSGGQYDAFERRLGEIAAKHGISDWETNDLTFLAFGEGLARAKVQGVGLETWAENLAGGNPHRIKLIQEGYRDYQRGR